MFTIAVLGLVVAMTVAAGAQPGGRGGAGGRGGGTRGGFGGFGGGGGVPALSSLVRIEEVQKEIEMSEDQVKEYEAARQDVSDDIRALERPDRESDEKTRDAYSAKITKIQKSLDREIEDVLLPHQSDRLWELYVQQNKSNALDHEVIAKKLEITAEQKKKLAKVSADMATKRTEMMRELFGNRGGGGGAGGAARGRGGRPAPEGEEGARPARPARPEGEAQPERARGGQPGARGGGFDFTEIREKMTKIGEDTEKARFAVLTSTQRKDFDAMKGKKFEFPERQQRGGRGGNTRGGNTRGGRGGAGGRPGADGGRPGADGARPPIQ